MYLAHALRSSCRRNSKARQSSILHDNLQVQPNESQTDCERFVLALAGGNVLSKLHLSHGVSDSWGQMFETNSDVQRQMDRLDEFQLGACFMMHKRIKGLSVEVP